MLYVHIMSIRKIIDKILGRDKFVLLDPEDGSVTFSESLYKQIDKDCNGKVDDIFFFQTNEKEGAHHYAFVCNPYESVLKLYADKRNRPVAKVQYNTKTKTIGCMPTCPTLAMMYYNWGLTWERVKVSVKRVRKHGITIYKICK